MKTFQTFILEAKKYTRIRSKEDAEKIRQTKENPGSYRLKNRQTAETPYWGLESREKRKKQGERRKENLKAVSQKELEDHCKRNLHPGNCKKNANKALRIERGRKRAQRDDARNKSRETGQKHDVDHIQAQPDKRNEKLKSRFQAIHPGDSSDNRRVIPSRENREKNSKNTEKSTTRSGALMRALQRAR